MDQSPEPTPEPPPPPKLLGTLRLKLQLAALGAAVLGTGAMIAPQATRPVVPASQERPVPLLEEELQRREPVRVFRPFQEIAGRVMVHNVTIPPPPRATPRTVPDFSTTAVEAGPSGFGVIVDAAGSVLTHGSALGSRSSLPVVLATGESVPAQLAAYEASTGLALLRLSDTRGYRAAPIDATRPEPGSVAATAARWQGRDVIAPVFVTSAGPQAYAIDAHGAALGGIALYNLEGQAFAIAAGPEHGIAFPLRDAVDRFSARAASGRSLDASIGLIFQPLDDALRTFFDARGVLVSRTIDRGPADAAGVAPGDLIVAVGDTPVDSPESAQKAIAALTPGTSTPIRLLRDSRPLSVTAVPGSAFDLAPRMQAPLAMPGQGITTGAVLSPETMRAAGIPPEATILQINGRAVSSRAEAARELSRTRAPVLLYLQYQDERFFAAAGGQR